MSTESKPKFTVSYPALGGGQIQAAIWENERTAGEESFTSVGVTISRRYYDDNDKQWKTTKTFRASDLLTIAFAVQEVYRQLTSEKQKPST